MDQYPRCQCSHSLCSGYLLEQEAWKPILIIGIGDSNFSHARSPNGQLKIFVDDDDDDDGSDHLMPQSTRLLRSSNIEQLI